MALYQPILSYGLIHWGGMAKYYIKPIDMLQTSVLKCINNNNNKKPSGIKILRLQELYRFQLLSFVLKNQSKFNIIYGEGKTRSKGVPKATSPNFNKTRMRIQSCYMGPKIYNTLPSELKIHLLNYKRRRRKLLTSFLTSESEDLNVNKRRR